MKQLEFEFKATDNGWEVQSDGKTFVYTSVQKAIKNSWMRAFYPKPHKASSIEQFKLILIIEERNDG